MPGHYEVDFGNDESERYDVGSSFETQMIETRPRTLGEETTPGIENVGRIVEVFEAIRKNGVLETRVPRKFSEAITELRSASKHKNVLIWDIRLIEDRATVLRLHVGKSTVSMSTMNDHGDLGVVMNVSDLSIHRS